MWDKSIKNCIRSLEKEGGRTKFIGKNEMRETVEAWEKQSRRQMDRMQIKFIRWYCI